MPRPKNDSYSANRKHIMNFLVASHFEEVTGIRHHWLDRIQFSYLISVITYSIDAYVMQIIILFLALGEKVM